MIASNNCTDLIRPIRDSLDIISGKWKIPILISLSKGTKRFNELEREVKNITPKMLSKELRDLELNELVSRKVYDGIPIAVEYSLTEHGKTLEEIVLTLGRWGIQHRTKLLNVDRRSSTNDVPS